MNILKGPALQKLIDKCPAGKPLADHLSEEFARINGIQLQIRSARLRMEAIKKKADDDIADLQKQVTQQQNRCLHEETTRHHCIEDPYTECNLCGKYL